MPPSPLTKLLTSHRRAHAGRFRHQRDWLRLSVLSGLLLTFGLFLFAETLSAKHLSHYAAANVAMFCGIAIVLFVARIARTEIYADWLLYGFLYIGAGLSLPIDEALEHANILLLFCFLLAASGTVRIWIGLTTGPPISAWITGSGGIAFAGSIGIATGTLFGFSLAPAALLALDTLFQGIAIARFSHSVRAAPGN